MWLNEGLQCAAETGFNYSDRCDDSFRCKSQEERQQKTLHDLCTITIFSDSNCKNSSSFSTALLGIVLVFLTSGVLLSFFFLMFTIRFRKNRIVKMSSPNLNVVTLLGSGLAYCSAFLFGIEKQNSLTRPSMEMLVQARICLLCIGVTLAFGPILGKSWRLYKVFTQQVPDKRVIIKDFQLLLMVSVLVLADIILLLIWVFLDPVQCLQSLNAELKGILLMYGAYLAGLTDDLSCPPVNQSLTLIVGITIIFLSTGILLVVNRFFHLWHNLVFGFTSGGICICTSTINCLIFIPQQVRQWKAFKKPDISNMAKYFTSSSKNFHSTMYSDEEIYQLLGEKNSMMQQLAEKDTAIARLQEQVNNTEEKLRRLMAVEDHGNAVDSPFPSTSHALQAHSTANCSSIAAENLPRDPFSLGQELKSWQYPQFTNSRYRPGLYSKKDCIDYLEWTNQQSIPADTTSGCRLVHGCKVDDCSSVKRDQDQWLSQYTATLSMGPLHDPLRQSLSTLSEKAKQTHSSPMNQKQLPGICYVSSEKLQEILQEPSMNHSTVAKTPSREPEQSADCEISTVWQPREMQANFIKLSPYKTRQEKKTPTHPPGSMAPNTWCNATKTSSKMQKSCSELTEFPWAAASSTKDESCLQHLPSLSSLMLKKTLHHKAENWSKHSSKKGCGWLLDEHPVEDCASTLYPSSSRNLCHRQQDFLTHTVLGPLPSELLYTDSDSSSSCGVTHCHHRQYCEVCHCSLSSSSDSCTTVTDPEPGMALDHCAKLYGKPQPTVNFNEDLEPTYV